MSSENKEYMKGSCACGASTFTSIESATHLDYCYCVQCQRMSGAPFIAWMGVPRSGLTFSGPIAHVKLSGIATRGFCGKCSGPMSLQYDCYPEKTHMPAACITRTDFEIPSVGIHIFVKSKPVWHRIADDGVPRYDEFDDEFAADFPEVVEHLKKD